MQLHIVLQAMKKKARCARRVYGRGANLGLDIKEGFPKEMAFELKSER